MGAVQKRRLKVTWLRWLCLENDSDKCLHLQRLQSVAQEVCRNQKGGISEEPHRAAVSSERLKQWQLFRLSDGSMMKIAIPLGSKSYPA